MSFLYPAFLAGAAAIAIPIVLHLLRREVAPEVPFTAVRLLRRSPPEQTRRRRLRELLLLAARVTALLLLAGAFARPYFASAAGAAGLRIVAVDRSFSMGAAGRFERARELAREAIAASGGGQQIAVIGFDDRATVLAAAGGAAEARAAVDAARPGYGATRFGPLFARAQELAGSTPTQLVIVSDLQRAGWSDDAPPSLAPGIEVDVRDVGSVPANLALNAVRPIDDAVIATVSNAGAATASGTIRISLGGQEVASAPFTAPAATAVDVPIGYRAPARGVLSAAIDDPAGYPADNRRLLLLDPGGRPRVSVVGSADAESGLYVARALQSADGDEGFDVQERTPASLASLPADALAPDNAVVLLTTRGLDRKTRESIAGFVRNGGGLLIAASDDVEATVLATAMGWERFSAPVQPDPAGVLAPTDMRHPVFKPFGALAANLGQARFNRSWNLRADGWDVLARFTNGGPALIERREGQGRVVLFASDLSRRWNDFPLTPAFVPFVIETVRHTAAFSAGRRDYLVADTPDGVPREPGDYANAGRRFTVNVDPRESATAVMTPADFTRMLRRSGGPPPGQQVERQAQQVEGRQNLWRYGLLLMMLALGAESIVGRSV